MKRPLFLPLLMCAALLGVRVAHAFDAGDLLRGAVSLGPAAAGTGDGRIADGLKEALGIGAERAVAVLGKEGGFLDDQRVRIPLPGGLDKVADGLRAIGKGGLVDEFEHSMNQAAEQAMPRSLDIVKSTVMAMTLDDARGILAGGDDSATRFLRRRGGPPLLEALLPIVRQSTDSSGTVKAYKAMLGNKKTALGALSALASPGGFDLDRYVTEKALDGLFLRLGEEERRIRSDPLARSTDLLRSVFGH